MLKQFSRWDILWVVGYAAVLYAVIAGMFYGRSWARELFSSNAAQADWDRWRDDVANQSVADSPVTRRVPKSQEPPALVLMRDYFGVCFVGAILLSSVLYAAFVFMLRGAIQSPGPVIAGPDDGPVH